MSSTPSDPSTSASSAVHDGRATFDFRKRPTRAAVGMGADGFVSYPKGTAREPVQATLEFPKGVVRGSFSEIDAGATYGFGPDRDPAHPPKYFDFFQRAKDLDAAQTLLRRDATALGLRESDIDGLTAEGTSVLLGLIDGWLSTYAQVRTNVGGGLNVIYSVAVDVYHNEAVDKIVHDGAVTIDLTSRPSRADLGFLSAYATADLTPEPGRRLSVTLRTPTGTATLPASTVGSSASSGDANPQSTVVNGSFDSVADAVSRLGEAATALGFDADEAASFLRAPAGDVRYREVPCAATSSYTCALRLSTTAATGPQVAAGYRLTLTYR